MTPTGPNRREDSLEFHLECGGSISRVLKANVAESCVARARVRRLLSVPSLQKYVSGRESCC
jgi:hypothetical protein